MASKDVKKISELLIKIGVLINENPLFIGHLETFLNSLTPFEKEIPVDQDKINSVELFQLIREKSVEDVEEILSEFNVKELREILKKYHFGSSSKLKTPMQLRQYIINQLNQRKTDVFQNS